MPIRIPQVVSQQGLDLGPAPYASGGLGELGGAPARALAETGQQVSQAIADYNKINKKLTEQDMKLDVESKLSLLSDHLAQEDIAITLEGVEPDERATSFQQRAGGHISDLAGQLKYPASAAEFRAKAEHKAQLETTKQRYKGLAVKQVRISVNTALANQQRALTAVNGQVGDDYFSPASMALRNQALQEIEDSVNENVTTGIWNEARAEHEIKQYKSEIQIGRATRQFEEPGYANAVITSLKKGQWSGVSGERQLALAEKLTNDQLAKTKQQKAEVKEAEKEVSDGAEKLVSDLLLARKFGDARTILSGARRLMEPTRYEHWSDTIVKQETAGGPSDPETKQQTQLDTYSVTNDPRVIKERVDQELRQGLLSIDDHKTYASHLETRINRIKDGDPMLARQHAQVEQNLKEQLRVEGALSPRINEQAQSILVLAMEDLSRNSAYLGRGEENPFDWETRRKAYYIARVGQVANRRLRDLDDQMRDGNGVAYATGTGNAKADAQALEAKRSTFKSPAEFLDQKRILMESYKIRQEITILQGRAQPTIETPPPSGTAAPKPQGAAPTPAGPGGGKQLGRPQGKP